MQLYWPVCEKKSNSSLLQKYEKKNKKIFAFIFYWDIGLEDLFNKWTKSKSITCFHIIAFNPKMFILTSVI